MSTFSSGFLEHITAFPANGMQIDTAFAPDGSKIETTTDLSNQHSWDKEIVSKDASGADAAKIDVNDNGTVSDPALASTSLAGDLGSLFGSKLGLLIGGNSLAGQLAAGTVMGAIGKEVGNALFASGSFSLDLVVEHAFGSLAGGSGVGSLPSGAIATVSSLLMAELADALNLHGFEGGLFQTAGTTITTQLVTNAYGMMTGATVNGLPNGPAYTMFTGFDSGAIFLNLSGAVAGYLGSTLAAHIATPHYAEGALGQQIGSSVGGLIGVWFGGPVGAFLGSFVGGVAGSILGDLAGNDPESHGRLTFQSGYFFPDPHSFWGDHGANGATFMNIATYTGNVVNGLADFAGVHMTLPPLPGGAVIPGGQTLDLLYTQDDHDFFINENGHPAFVWLHNVQHADDLAPLVTTGVMDLVHHVDVAGGDPLVGLAWKNSHADNPSAFALDLQVAKDYRTWLDDKYTVNALMAAEPESAFTAGWVLTLLKAHELGLDAAPATQDFRAGNELFNGTPYADLLIGGPGNDALNGADGNDRLDPGPGTNTVDGGGGTDLAVFHGPAANYLRFAYNGQIYVGTADGTERDVLSNVEYLQFSDQAVASASVPVFNANAVDWLDYIASYPDLMAAYHTDWTAGLNHYLNAGFFEGRHVSFDGLNYIASYPDLMAAFGLDHDAGTRHYINGGYAAEGRHVTFDPAAYMAANPGLQPFSFIPNFAASYYITDGHRASLASSETLAGTAGGDFLFGGPGNDTFIVNHPADTVVENPGEGYDTVLSSLTFTLGTDVESLWLAQGAGAINGTGNALNNWIIGNAANNWAFGLGGDDAYSYTGGLDFFDGGTGSDTLDFGSFAGAVLVDLTVDYAPEVWTRDTHDLDTGLWRTAVDVVSVENVIGSIGNDRVFGDGGANIYYYNGGLDTFDGRGGADTVDFSRFGSAVSVDLTVDYAPEAWTQDRPDLTSGTWRAAVDLASVENMTGSPWADRLFGDANANAIRGGAGNDTLMGRGGADAFYFGAGDGSDTITDFTPGADSIWLTGTGLHSFAEVQAAATYNAATGATTIAYSGGALTLPAITPAQLAAADFHVA